jgi:hypothetical protein
MKPKFFLTHRKIMIAIITAMLCFLSISTPLAATRGLLFLENFSEIDFDNHAKTTADRPAEQQRMPIRLAMTWDKLRILGGDSTTSNPIAADTWSQHAKLTASDGAFMDQFGASVSISGDTLVVGARYDNNNQGSAYVFEKPGGGWTDMTQTAKLTASDGAANDQFGYAVAISGDIVVIGARGNDGFIGAAYVYEKPMSGWTDMTETAKLTASDGAASKVLGSSVAISGDTIVVGADGDTDNGFNSGAAYVFRRPVAGWSDMTETAKLLASDGAAYDDFGASVAISGDTVTVGANGDDLTHGGQGSAYVFVRTGGGWINMTETAKLHASDGAEEDFFGVSVTIDGDTVVVGAPGVDITNGTTIYNVGRAYVFEKPGGGWTDMTETAKLTASDGEANDDFGASVAIRGDTVAIGAWGNDGYNGAAYIFEKPSGIWTDTTETAKLTASDGMAFDDFGYSVAISQDTVVAGAHLDDDNGNSSGSAYVFTVSGGQEPVPDIKANGSDGPLTITQFDNLIIEIALDPGIYTGYPADWWVLADTPFGWYYYDLNNWRWGQSVTYQGGLSGLAPYEVLNTSGLSTGNYIFYFGVDGKKDGKITNSSLYYDSVEVTITP